MKPINQYLINQAKVGASRYELRRGVNGLKDAPLREAYLELLEMYVNSQNELEHVRAMYSNVFEDLVEKKVEF